MITNATIVGVQWHRSFNKLWKGFENRSIMPLVLLVWFLVFAVNCGGGGNSGGGYVPTVGTNTNEQPSSAPQYEKPNFITDVGDPTSMVGAEGLRKQVENSYRLNRCYPSCTGSTFGDNQMEQSFYNDLNQRSLGPGEVQGYQDFSNGPTFPGYIDFNKSD